MIHVKRGLAPVIFTAADGPALKERQLTEAYYSQVPPPVKEFPFKFYSSYKDKYKESLIKLFNGRCAYCECYVREGDRGDIEHFRPKSQYTRRDGTIAGPGYYWLSADWSNLYLSCPNCNQKTTFEVLDPENPGSTIKKVGGKMTHFALEDEKFRRNHHAAHWEDEEPHRLLIDPCRDDPGTLLRFTPDGSVLPLEQKGLAKEKAEYSIDVYVLRRVDLVKARREKYLQIMDKMKFITDSLPLVTDNIKRDARDKRHKFFKEQLELAFLQMMAFLDIEKTPNQYIGLARQYIHPFLHDYSDRLAAFLRPQNRNRPWYTRGLKYFEPQVKILTDYFSKDLYRS